MYLTDGFFIAGPNLETINAEKILSPQVEILKKNFNCEYKCLYANFLNQKKKTYLKGILPCLFPNGECEVNSTDSDTEAAGDFINE